MNKRIAMAVLGVALIGAFVGSAAAQFRGVPAGATSMGGNRSSDNPPGVPAGATSLGPRGYAVPSGVRFEAPVRRDLRDGQHARRVIIPVAVPLYGYGYGYYPYASGYTFSTATTASMNPAADVADAPLSQLTPAPVVVQAVQQPPQVIVIDNRGVRDATDEEKAEAIATSKAKKAKQDDAKPEVKREAEDVGPMTLIVFRDGSRKEIKNYAIMGKELIVLGPGNLRRISLADIDVKATQQENDVRGLDFKLP
jgi:hypothetical protein